MANIQGILCLIFIIIKINKWWRITGKQGSSLLFFSTLGFMSSLCSLFFTSMFILLCSSNMNTSYNLTISKRRKCHISASATTAEKLPFPCWSFCNLIIPLLCNLMTWLFSPVLSLWILLTDFHGYNILFLIIILI